MAACRAGAYLSIEPRLRLATSAPTTMADVLKAKMSDSGGPWSEAFELAVRPLVGEWINHKGADWSVKRITHQVGTEVDMLLLVERAYPSRW